MRNHRDQDEASGDRPEPKLAYHSPVLTEYGSIEDLVDSGVVAGPIVPSIMKPPPLF